MPAPVGTAHVQLMATPPGVVVLRSDSLVAWVLPYGARLMQLFWLKAPEGVRPLSLGFVDPNSYRSDSMSIGAVCGRYANRIAGARLQRGTTEYILDANHPLGHCIHGGRAGWGQRDWQLGRHDAASVELMLDSADGDMGFPGRCQSRVQYQLQGDRLLWQADATVDQECPINMVQHSYWNLDASPNLRDHRLQVEADTYHPVDHQELPMLAQSVANTCFDFRVSAPIPDACIDHLDAAMVLRPNKEGMRPVARLQGGGLAMQVSTDRPFLHVYASSNLRVSATPLRVAHGPGAAVCLETEDMPNGPALGSAVWYGPRRNYTHSMAFDFSAVS